MSDVFYNALEDVREINYKKFGIDAPKQPKDIREVEKEHIGNLERAALSFVRELCKDLRYKEYTDASKDDIAEYEKMAVDKDHDKELLYKLGKTIFTGVSTEENQIPYNMQMDIDRLCLENAIHRFMKNGIAENAFDVYFCYLEMFIGNYGESKKMIEKLAEFEANASSLLMKHRDHYSHSVYVFILGLAIFYENELFRDAYRTHYKDLTSDEEAAHHFLKYWGLTALFHDIGYPFELPFEQVKSYFGDTIKEVPFLAYRGVADYINVFLSYEDASWMTELVDKKFEPENLNDILAYNIAEKLGDTYKGYKGFRDYKAKNPKADYREYIAKEVLGRKPGEPDRFNGYMDHAYFSAIILFKQLIEVLGVERVVENPVYIDTLTAIVLHNSMYKFCITNVKEDKGKSHFNACHRLDEKLHPLAYMLMLCDELQCWDRTSYGQNSRSEVHAMDCEFVFEGNKITAIYLYDKDQETKIKKLKQQAEKKHKAIEEVIKGTYTKMQQEKCADQKEKRTEPKCDFLTDIEDIIRINKKNNENNQQEKAPIELCIKFRFAEKTMDKQQYLSNSNFIHLYNFAVALNARYQGNPSDAEMDEAFNQLSLEYKLSNIQQAKAFARYLNEIDCFYTDRPVSYNMLNSGEKFNEKELRLLGAMEHGRWWSEKLDMNWKYDGSYADLYKLDNDKDDSITGNEIKNNEKMLRELTRTHMDMVANGKLNQETKDKDTDPMNMMIDLLEHFDGLRIYRLRYAGKIANMQPNELEKKLVEVERECLEEKIGSELPTEWNEKPASV